MKIFKNIAIISGFLFSLENASAHCTGYHPHHCSIADIAGAHSDFFINIGKTFEKAYDDIDREWKKIYHNAFPEEQRRLLNAIIPLTEDQFRDGINPTTYLNATSSALALTTQRAQEAAQIIRENNWKSKIVAEGNSYYLTKQMEVASYSRNAQKHYNNLNSQNIWGKYLVCVNNSRSYDDAFADCYFEMKVNLDNWANSVLLTVRKTRT